MVLLSHHLGRLSLSISILHIGHLIEVTANLRPARRTQQLPPLSGRQTSQIGFLLFFSLSNALGFDVRIVRVRTFNIALFNSVRSQLGFTTFLSGLAHFTALVCFRFLRYSPGGGGGVFSLLFSVFANSFTIFINSRSVQFSFFLL
uniref:Uncharacterized protein n=1 Tax=Cacopsylla melanoneura TaxID=428564 RepID=A0A8D8QW30_9HEMI